MLPEWLTFERLLLHSIQFTIILGLGLLLPRVLRLRNDRAVWLHLEAAIAIALVAPLVNPLWLYQQSLRGLEVFFPSLHVLWLFDGLGEPGFRLSTTVLAQATPEPARLGLLWIVLAGAALMLFWRLSGRLRLGAFRRKAKEVELYDVLGAETLQLHQRFGVEARYYVSDQIDGPLTWGAFNHTIMFPQRFLELPEAQRRAIVVHELVHCQSHDWAKLLHAELWRSLLWFNPLVHVWARWRGRLREQIVDREAIQFTKDRKSYLDALVEIARIPVRNDALVAPLFLERNNLKQRVKVILEEGEMSKFRSTAFVWATAALLLLVGHWTRSSFPLIPQAQAAERVYKVGEDGVAAPRLLKKIDPEYTQEAEDANLEGTIVLSVEVHADGRAYNLRIERGLGMGLDERAIEAIKQWKFQPAMKGDEPVAVSARIEVNFKRK